jgi:demethylmenaquinone methyltransferase/2-methoxy-6-polyprenyl-1,4-benzoquinol methylase
VSKEDVAKRIKAAYGGTSQQDIAAGTQRRIEASLRGLPDHLRLAAQLYQKLTLWDDRVSRMSLLEQSKIPPADAEGAERAREELDGLMDRHNLTKATLHNTFQQITWDSSADAKAARALAGAPMQDDVRRRIDRACSIVAESVAAREGEPLERRCLDVGCGYGVLVPHLVQAGVKPRQIVGVDLSPEMIRNAREQHGGGDRSRSRGGGNAPQFVACDFVDEFQDPEGSGFDAVLFCSSLHDMPDPILALHKAAGLLNREGVLVIVHPQGAGHVQNQRFQNPTLVRRGLPDAAELEELARGGAALSGLQVVTAPAPAGSTEESNQGYLAVLKRIK